jgi:hypothetical protein
LETPTTSVLSAFYILETQAKRSVKAGFITARANETTAPRLRALALCALLARASTARAASATTAAPPLPLRDLQYAHRPVGFDGGGWVTGLVAHAATGIVYARTDVGGAYRSDDGGRSWQWLSGFAGVREASFWETHGLDVNQSDPSGQTLLVLLGNQEAGSPSTGVWKSGDGGRSWRHVLANVTANSNGFTRHASPVLTIDAARPWRVWCGAQQGLFRSDDGGESFQAVASFNSAPWWTPGAWDEFALVALVPPRAPGEPADPALAAHVVAGTQGIGLVFSADDGATWTRLTHGVVPMWVSSPWRFLRFANGTSIVALDQAGGFGKTSGRVWRVTADSPAAWANASQWSWADITPNATGSNDDGFWGLVDTPEGPDGGVLAVASSAWKSLYTSTDLGTTWTLRGTAVQPGAAPCWQPNPNVWMQVLPWGRNSIVTTSRRPGTWLIATGFGVAASEDGGDSWSWSSAGIGQVVSFRCHSHPTRANHTFCGAADLSGFLITDAGVSSRGASVYRDQPEYFETDFGKGVAWDAAGGPGLQFAGGVQAWPMLGLWVSWPAPGSTPFTPASVVATPGVNLTGALAGVPLQFVGLLQALDDPLDLLLVVAPKDNSGKFSPWNASTMPAANYTGGVVRSRNGGATWAHVAQQPASGDVGTVWGDRQEIVHDGGDTDARWWALWGSGLYLSRDRGETWGAPLPYFSATELEALVAPDASAATGGKGCVYVLGAGGQIWSRFKPGQALLHTSDYGVSWRPVGNFTASWAAPTLATHRSGRIALTAFAGADELAHVWVSLDSGASWTAVDEPADGEFLAPGVSGLEWDAVDPTVLYVSLAGRSVVVVKLAQ